MAEWSNAAVLKTAEPETVPGFESLSFRHSFSLLLSCLYRADEVIIRNCAPSPFSPDFMVIYRFALL